MNDRPNLQKYSVQALLDYITEQSAFQPSSLTANLSPQVFKTSLRNYQLEGLSFMTQVECEATNTSVTGGWLADEMGLGKTAVILALAISNPMPVAPMPTTQQIAHFVRANSKSPAMKVKCTVILTSVSLMGQWEDECHKHAPSLVVVRYHPASRKQLTRQNLASADVIISTSTFQWSNDIVANFEFHRVVVDESHLLGTASANVDVARRIQGQRRWCVTGTPFTTSVFDLMPQVSFLSPTATWKHDKDLHIALYAFRDPSNTATAKQGFYMLADVLKKCIVRHTKAQQMQAKSQALVLPSSTSSTIYLSMSVEEQNAFGGANASTKTLERYVEYGCGMFSVQQSLLFQMKDTIATSKIGALVADLIDLQRAEPAMRVVVYTQYKAIQDACIPKLEQLGFAVYHFNGSTSAKKRDDMIRNFQNQLDGKPAVFVITLRSGSVGITLTSATRVYLMEPCLDPAAEIQAAGRIHRLGQDRPVEVKKYVFRYSVEANIVTLHQEIAAGRISLRDGSFLPPEAMKILTKGVHSRSAAIVDDSQTRMLDV
jgi:non-specific serine/threonine protein kinase